MNIKKLLIAWVAAAATMLALGGLFHRVLAGDFLMSQMAELPAKMPSPGIILVMILPIALIMAFMYPKGYQGGHPAVEGFRFGALIGIIMALPVNVLLIGLFDLPIAAALADVPWHIVEEGTAGIVIGLVYGRSQKAAASE